LKTPIFGDTKYGYDPLTSKDFFSKRIDTTNTILLHAGELHLPITPGDRESVTKFTGKMKGPMERVLDQLHIPKGFYQ
jgi:23S rRNA-/tRNA-specific pseudouridylate synthase